MSTSAASFWVYTIYLLVLRPVRKSTVSRGGHDSAQFDLCTALNHGVHICVRLFFSFHPKNCVLVSANMVHPPAIIDSLEGGGSQAHGVDENVEPV